MFKLVVLSALVAVSMAAPSGLLAYSSPLVAHSTVVGSVPTSISSHSSSVVHSHSVHTSPIVADVPVVAAVRAAPVVHSVAVPAVHTVAAGPVVSSYSHGLVEGAVVSAPLVHSVHGVHGIHGLQGVHVL